MNLLNLDEKITAAAVAAAGTIIGTLIQLHVARRREASERARGGPAAKKSRRNLVLAGGLLLIGAALGGFAFSQYLVRQSDLESTAVRGQLQAQLAQINATAARLERAAQSDHGSSDRSSSDRSSSDHSSSARNLDDSRGAEGIAVTTTVGPCRARTVVAPDAAPTCDEQEALRVTLCASVPSLAVVTAMALYARPEDSPQPWTESRVPGQDFGHARFADKTFERAESPQTKQVCTDFSSWDGERGYSARLVVKYVMAPAPSEVSNEQLVPVSGVTQ